MRHPVRLLLSVLLLSALLISVPAVAEDDPLDPCADDSGDITYRQEPVWFHEGDSKVGNLADRAGQAPAPWDTTEPTASVTSAAGAGALSNLGSLEATAADSANSAIFAGTFDGCMDTILVELYGASPTNRTGTSGSAEPAPHNFSAELTIDGETFSVPGPAEAVTTDNENGNATERFGFAVTDVRRAMERRGLDLTASHEMTLTVTAWFANTNNTVYLWDTTEVPAGMVFNGIIDETYEPVRLF